MADERRSYEVDLHDREPRITRVTSDAGNEAFAGWCRSSKHASEHMSMGTREWRSLQCPAVGGRYLALAGVTVAIGDARESPRVGYGNSRRMAHHARPNSMRARWMDL